MNVGKHLRIGFLVSFSVSMSLSLSVSSSLDNCVCAVVVDLEAGRELSKDAVALHATEQSAAGVLKVKQHFQSSRQRAAENRPWTKPVGASLRAAGGNHIYRLFSAAGGGPQTAGKH